MTNYYKVFWDNNEEGIETAITTIVGAPDFKGTDEVKALFIADCKLRFKNVIIYEFNQLEMGNIKIDKDNLFSAEGDRQRWCSVVLLIPAEPTNEYKPHFDTHAPSHD